MNRTKFFVTCIGFFILFTPHFNAMGNNTNDVFGQIMLNVRNDKYKAAPDNVLADVDFMLNYLSANGSFSDINYSNTDRTNWGPLEHLKRVNTMVHAYISPNTRHHASAAVHELISRALGYWHSANPRSSNWWYNQIAVPQTMGELLIGMEFGHENIATTLRNNILTRMRTDGGNPSQQTGANKVDVAMHWLYRACLERNATDLQYASNQSFVSLSITTNEGIQHDGSYFQHGQQFYIGGYGRVLIDGVVKIAKYLVATPYALAGQQLEVFSNFVRTTYLRSIRGSFHLYNTLGRGISRDNATSQHGFALILNDIKRIDSAHADFYDKAIQRVRGEKPASFEVEELNKHYWRGDYSLHQRKNYSFDVRMASTRTLRNENLNQENLKGYFLTDGATAIAVDGDEYAYVFPVWDWTKIPGTTTPAVNTIPLPNSYIWPGKSTFAGGVSDGKYGATGFVLNNNEFNINTFGKKSWFFFDDEVICLGADINSQSDFGINTTLNQCSYKAGNTGIVVSANNNIVQKPSAFDEVHQNVDWVLHNKVAYYFIGNNPPVHINLSRKTGSWYDINRTQDQAQVASNVFTLWLNHGIKPQNASYAYVVVPNTLTAVQADNYNVDNLEIIVNSDSVQAVRHKALGVVSAIFYRAATLQFDNATIRANKSCAILLKDFETDNVSIHVSDPAQTSQNIELMAKLPAFSNTKKLTVNALSSPNNGRSQQFTINNDTETYIEPTQYPSVVVEASADTYVHGGNTNTNYGTAQSLVVKADNTAWAREAYLRFPSNHSLIPNAIKIQLELTISNVNTSATTTQWILSSDPVNRWNESTLTWNTQPDKTGFSKLAEIPVVNVGEKMIFDITNFVKTQNQSNATQLSLHIAGSHRAADGKNDAQFFSRETENIAHRPILRIMYDNSTNAPKVTTALPIATYIKRGQALQVKGDIAFYSLTVYDMVGNKILTSNKSDIDTHSLTPGVYILSAKSKESNTLKNARFIVYN